MIFNDLLLAKDGMIKGPFGGDVKKSLFIPYIRGAYKVLEQSIVINNNISQGSYFLDGEYVERRLKRFIVNEGDILITGAGTLGKLFEVKTLEYPSIINQALIRIRINESIVYKEFFKYYFGFHFIKLISGINGDSVIPNLPPLDVIKKTQINIPDLPTQQKIASVLSALDDKIELNNKINAELEAMAKTLYDYWFLQFEFPISDTEALEGSTDPTQTATERSRLVAERSRSYKSSGGKMVYNPTLKREIPEGWEVKRFGDVFNVSRGTLITKETSTEGTYKVVAAGLNYSYLTGDFNREKYTITVSGSGANAGYVNFWTERIFASDCTTIRGNSDSETFLALQFLKLFQNYIFSLAKGSAQPHVYPSDIEGLYYVCPPDNLIELYGNSSYNIYEKIANNLKQNQELAQLRDWLLPMLMNGQVTIK